MVVMAMSVGDEFLKGTEVAVIGMMKARQVQTSSVPGN